MYNKLRDTEQITSLMPINLCANQIDDKTRCWVISIYYDCFWYQLSLIPEAVLFAPLYLILWLRL